MVVIKVKSQASDYPRRNSYAYRILLAFEESVKSLADQFADSERAFNFLQEAELSAHLLMGIRQHKLVSSTVTMLNRGRAYRREIARLEWSCYHSEFDLVLWYPTPGNLNTARDSWTNSRKTPRKRVKVLAAVQIKRGQGSIVPYENGKHCVRKDLESLQKMPISRHAIPLLYFIEFVDADLVEGKTGQYIETEQRLRVWCNRSKARRRALVLARNGIGFAYPIDRWLVDPLPQSQHDGLNLAER